MKNFVSRDGDNYRDEPREDAAFCNAAGPLDGCDGGLCIRVNVDELTRLRRRVLLVLKRAVSNEGPFTWRGLKLIFPP